MKKAIIVLIMVAITGITVSCSKRLENEDRSVAILKYGSHSLIDEIEVSIKKGLVSKYGDDVLIRTYNANFDEGLLKQSTAQIFTGKFKVAIPITTPATIELLNGTGKDQAIVFSFVSAPSSLWGEDNDRPENVTGTSDQIDYAKNIDLIRRTMPKAKRLGYLVNQGEPQAQIGFEEVKRLALKNGFEVIAAPIGAASEVPEATRGIVGHVDVFLVGGDNTVVSGVGGLLAEASKHNIPVFAVERTSVENGCVAAYGVDYSRLGAETSNLAIDILEGKKPSQLDVIYFNETKLYVNQESLNERGLTIPDKPDITY